MEKNEVIHIYCANNAQKIHKIVDKILKKFGGITVDDHEECYGIAYEVFTNLIKSDKYDPNKSFDGWFYMCVSYKLYYKEKQTQKMPGSRKQRWIMFLFICIIIGFTSI